MNFCCEFSYGSPEKKTVIKRAICSFLFHLQDWTFPEDNWPGSFTEGCRPVCVYQRITHATTHTTTHTTQPASHLTQQCAVYTHITSYTITRNNVHRDLHPAHVTHQFSLCTYTHAHPLSNHAVVTVIYTGLNNRFFNPSCSFFFIYFHGNIHFSPFIELSTHTCTNTWLNATCTIDRTNRFMCSSFSACGLFCNCHVLSHFLLICSGSHETVRDSSHFFTMSSVSLQFTELDGDLLCDTGPA